MSKTIKQWLETLPEPYRTEALDNMDKDDQNDTCDNISSAISYAFYWEKTKQGFEYWHRLDLSIENGTFYIKQLQDRITLIEAKHGVTLNAPPETQSEYQQLKKELETKIHKL